MHHPFINLFFLVYSAGVFCQPLEEQFQVETENAPVVIVKCVEAIESRGIYLTF